MDKKVKNIIGYEGDYIISNSGNVVSVSRPQSRMVRILKGEVDDRGYKRVRLSRGSKTKKYQIHRLVAIAFIPNPSNKPCVNHIDGNPSNNNVTNLEWCTNSENMKHAFKTGLQSLKGEKNTQSKLTKPDVLQIKELLSKGELHKNIATVFNVSRRCITDINIGNTWAYDL